MCVEVASNVIVVVDYGCWVLFLVYGISVLRCLLIFFFNDTATTEIYTLSLHDALPILDCGIADRVSAQTLLACFHELFGPRVEVGGLDAFTSTQFVDCDLATKAFQDYVDLLFCGVFPTSR